MSEFNGWRVQITKSWAYSRSLPRRGGPMSPVKSLALAAASALVGVTLAFAQASDTGSLRGRITDGTGAALPGVTVTASSPAVMGGSLTTLTASEGLYRF